MMISQYKMFAFTVVNQGGIRDNYPSPFRILLIFYTFIYRSAICFTYVYTDSAILIIYMLQYRILQNYSNWSK